MRPSKQMLSFVKLAATTVLLGLVLTEGHAVDQLLPKMEPCPDGKLAANVEWETLGQVGVLRMKIFDASARSVGKVEVPQVRPEPADLTWLDNRWVMCESFMGERASGFFYVDAQSLRGYLLEIYSVKGQGSWEFDVSYSDRDSSFSVSNASIGRTCLFPIVLGPVPNREEEYFRVEFCQRFTAAVDAFRSWMQEKKWQTFDVIGQPAIREGTGGLALCSHDEKLALVYFSLRADSPQNILRTARFLPLPPEVVTRLSADKTNVVLSWGEKGDFTIRRRSSKEETAPANSEGEVLYKGTVENAVDGPATLVLDTDISRKPDDAAIKSEGEDLGDAAERNKHPSAKESKASRKQSGGKKSTPVPRRH